MYIRITEKRTKRGKSDIKILKRHRMFILENKYIVRLPRRFLIALIANRLKFPWSCTPVTHTPPVVTEWPRLLLHVICSVLRCVTMQCQHDAAVFPVLSLVTLTFDLWPWNSNSPERGTKHVFLANLAQIRSSVPEIFETQTKTKKAQR